jgi:hypothetical protein
VRRARPEPLENTSPRPVGNLMVAVQMYPSGVTIASVSNDGVKMALRLVPIDLQARKLTGVECRSGTQRVVYPDAASWDISGGYEAHTVRWVQRVPPLYEVFADRINPVNEEEPEHIYVRPWRTRRWTTTPGSAATSGVRTRSRTPMAAARAVDVLPRRGEARHAGRARRPAAEPWARAGALIEGGRDRASPRASRVASRETLVRLQSPSSQSRYRVSW